jgi:cell shape-determining protein MreD
MKQWILYLILALSFILEGTITTLPLVLISFLILMIFLRAKFLFWLAFVAGIMLDIFLLRPLGLTSLMLIIFLFFVVLYENKFESSTAYFILVVSFLGSLIYLLILGLSSVLIQSVFVAFLTLGIFKLLMHSEIQKPKYTFEK